MTPSPITAACQRLTLTANQTAANPTAEAVEAFVGFEGAALFAADLRAVVEAAQRWAKVAPFLHVEHTQRGMYTTKRQTELVLHDDNGEPLEIRADHASVEAFVDALPALPAPEEREGPQP